MGCPGALKVNLFQAKNWTLPLLLLPSTEEKEPPWSSKQSRDGMGNGGRRGHRDRGAGQAGAKSQLQAGPDHMGHTDVPTMVWQSWVRALEGLDMV